MTQKTLTRASNVAQQILNTREHQFGGSEREAVANLLAEAFCLGYLQGCQGPHLTEFEEAEKRFGFRSLGPEDYNLNPFD